MTVEALKIGFCMLAAHEQEHISKGDIRLEMCIFMEKELKDFEDAFQKSS
eukprot:CAMPEP_0169419182 /NCGR_PEP_ID=MMETSP1017-20121227/64823_1 /TAXON_ID=342587 /ORGANISM="Karlodinium micrum, Strain CCMP2283" /LENGTH=49 /DNA_ID=CAMNT_0009527787 /DNA_START=99 /DNA_END=248 /DNA_ORIENTATION=-